MNLSVQNIGQIPTTIQVEGELNTKVDLVVMILSFNGQEVHKSGYFTERNHQFTITLPHQLEPHFSGLIFSLFGYQRERPQELFFELESPCKLVSMPAVF